ncbi:MAG: DNA photolyase family protein [Campylobacterales bacterium]
MRQLLWFRRDLRIEDSAILAHAQGEVLPLFIFDPALLVGLDPKDRRVGFIWSALTHLKEKLQLIGLDLALFYAPPVEVFKRLAREGFDEILASCDYDRYAIERDSAVERILPLRRFYDSYLFRFDEIVKSDHTPYRIYTPYAKQALKWLHDERFIPQKPAKVRLVPFDYASLHLFEHGAWKQLPRELEAIGFQASIEWSDPQAQWESFVASNLSAYATKRDYPALGATSSMGVHLRFGTISVKTMAKKALEQGAKLFVGELLWRDFFAQLLYHFPRSEEENFQPLKIPWENNEEVFRRWCEGQTGWPIVDAGMRQLMATGWMHNRVRMVVASVLTKYLLVDWRWGEAFFAKHLIDYDAASNVGNWQWAAGTGADAQPFFRTFNPWLQAAKFDPEGYYIKQWVPELKMVPAKLLHNEEYFLSTKLPNYPRPLMAASNASKRAAQLFAQLKNQTSTPPRDTLF